MPVEEYNRVIYYYQPVNNTVKSFKADVSSVSLSSERLTKGLILETSALKLFTVASLPSSF